MLEKKRSRIQSSLLKPRFNFLRRRSYRKQDLSGADFSSWDIRGIDFSYTVLESADFSNATAGVTPPYKIGLSIGSFVFSLISGSIMGYASAFPIFIQAFLDESSTFGRMALSIAAFVVLATSLILAIRKGLGSTLGFFILVVAALVVIVSAVGTGEILAATLVQAMAIAGAIAGLVLGAIVIATAIFTKFPIALSLLLMFFGAALGVWEGLQGINIGIGASAVFITLSSILSLLTISLYLGTQSNIENSKYFLIRVISLKLSTLGSTSFKGANLTLANFTSAKLPSTDFRHANLRCSNFFKATGLEQARLDSTPLYRLNVRKLLTTRNGQGQNFDRQNLRDLNLNSANLQDASFIGADLSGSSLENANFTGAKLAGTKLHQSILNSAILTGAVIENWGLSTDTQLGGIICDFIYTRLPTPEDLDPCRKPDNKKEFFELGDFDDFITPFLRTLGLYKTQNVNLRQIGREFRTLDLFHHESIEPAAVALALQQVGHAYPEAELEILSVEGRSNDKVRLQTKVATNIDREKLSAEYHAIYEQLKALPDRAFIGKLGNQLKNLEEILSYSITQPKYYIETYIKGDQNLTQNQGNISINASGNVQGISTVSASGDVTMTGVQMGDISAEVENSINSLSKQAEDSEPALSTLLFQLKELIETESKLSPSDKQEALEQVKILADAGVQPSNSALKKATGTALKILKGTTASLPEATKLVEGFAKLLPAIQGLLPFL